MYRINDFPLVAMGHVMASYKHLQRTGMNGLHCALSDTPVAKPLTWLMLVCQSPHFQCILYLCFRLL